MDATAPPDSGLPAGQHVVISEGEYRGDLQVTVLPGDKVSSLNLVADRLTWSWSRASSAEQVSLGRSSQAGPARCAWTRILMEIVQSKSRVAKLLGRRVSSRPYCPVRYTAEFKRPCTTQGTTEEREW